MNLFIVSTFWNCEKYIAQCIKSIKRQYYTNFTAYFIDDKSTDDSYNVAKNAIGDDKRFILIKNDVKKYKTKNFIDVIRENKDIEWNDVIIEIDGDDKLSDNYVLGRINKIYTNDDIWICGSRWKDKDGNSMRFGKCVPESSRSANWNFSHMRSYRAFLFRNIKDNDLKYEGEYFKSGCDIGMSIPMLEMAGSEHYYYLDDVTYVYTWHDKQSYSDNNSFGDGTLQEKVMKHILNSTKYPLLKLGYSHAIVKNPYIPQKIVDSKPKTIKEKIYSSFEKKEIDQRRQNILELIQKNFGAK